MSQLLQKCAAAGSLFLLYVILIGGFALGTPSMAADAACRFKAGSEATEIHVLVNGNMLWKGVVEKQETRTLSVPEGSFTVISKLYNPNLKRKEDVRAEMHTRQCRNDVPFNVPLFPEDSAR
jgi:hypothetical protein